jgi:hypothetical protein
LADTYFADEYERQSDRCAKQRIEHGNRNKNRMSLGHTNSVINVAMTMKIVKVAMPPFIKSEPDLNFVNDSVAARCKANRTSASAWAHYRQYDSPGHLQ